MTASIIIIACSVLILLALPLTHAMAYFSGVAEGRAQVVVLMQRVSPEAARIFSEKLDENKP